MYIIGGLISFLNVATWGQVALALMTCNVDSIGSLLRCIGGLFVPIIALGMIILPTFGGIIALSPVQNNAWHHRCDPFRLQVVLNGRSHSDASYVPDVAHFYTGNGGAPLFTYDLDATGSDTWTFHFRELDVAEASIPAAFMPVLRAVTYNFIDNTVNGTCGANGTLCMSGTFNDGDYMSFALDYNVTGPAPVHAAVRIEDRQWAFSDDALRSVKADNSLGSVVLQTAVTKRSDCTQLLYVVHGIDRVLGLARPLVGQVPLPHWLLTAVHTKNERSLCIRPMRDMIRRQEMGAVGTAGVNRWKLESAGDGQSARLMSNNCRSQDRTFFVAEGLVLRLFSMSRKGVFVAEKGRMSNVMYWHTTEVWGSAHDRNSTQ